MKFARLAKINLDVSAQELEDLEYPASANLAVLYLWHYEGDRSELVVAGLVDVTDSLAIDDNGTVDVSEFLSVSEAYIEQFADMVAVSRSCSRQIKGVMPPGGLVPETDSERDLLNSLSVFSTDAGIIERPPSKIDPGVLHQLSRDRIQGVTLLAEALSSSHPSGRFHELWRFFELAFGFGGQRLRDTLADFLECTPDQGFERSEEREWYDDIRNPLTHATISGPELVVERVTRSVVGRLEQAAYDVLLNKRDWGSESIERRVGWRRPFGTDSPE
ncbi:MAG: hypothetical protein ACREX3_25665, partial [Gammaproteobacteria bacterium]